MAKSKNKSNSSGSVRIIGGRWRGRKISFADLSDLRPTPDRVRETVFNWLQADLGGAHCLDAFAGSGVLGFEAASRGARSVDLVEQDKQAFALLNATQQQLQAGECRLFRQDVRMMLTETSQPYDVVFLDPPYRLQYWQSVAELLEERKLLQPHSLIYLEYPAGQAVPVLPENWQMQKSKTAGDVTYCLFARAA
ncbi:Ribosomal RNA small subunit methyltransferase D [Methylophaga frappieri]|uniref:Ribosomal RNA small subunit methyltransferase D n=1 Tax=Methylophaga frappieri (strain ATCC BAA-2434 / DSM 25690 / JAM7) TaxID=754477 RepID=I1YFT3_METFJ|nr:16S rRNA (guanine(966)-N(2))-methyltransferase RsmD [Methylophaga frappieri]AFJ01776.1 Ribosomal RNA small subunit methyltransferase D [Methylophaga frappieri]